MNDPSCHGHLVLEPIETRVARDPFPVFFFGKRALAWGWRRLPKHVVGQDRKRRSERTGVLLFHACFSTHTMDARPSRCGPSFCFRLVPWCG